MLLRNQTIYNRVINNSYYFIETVDIVDYLPNTKM